MRPHEAQEKFVRAAGEIKEPEILSVEPRSESIALTWQRRPGKIDGFIILLGLSLYKLQEFKRLKDIEGFQFSDILLNLINGKEYFIGIIAYKDNGYSELLTVWKATPNIASRIKPAKKISGKEVSEYKDPARPAETLAPVPGAQAPASIEAGNLNIVCASCMADVVFSETERVFICQGCNTKYVQRVTDGKYIPLTILTNGICICCNPRRPLIKRRGDAYKKCSLSGEEYADLNGGVIKISELDYGLCRCCLPHQPLKLNHSGQVVCSRLTDKLYVKENNRYIMRAPEAPASLVDEIDKALGGGSAVMLPNGILTANSPGGTGRNRRR
ncbi:MAG: fibronectin type III domain-containing protein [Candidatus Buchananbacteria bacterium]|nr:fibronectin type III domain-containing protein [Candidatus Buchananbacteria bacterium]